MILNKKVFILGLIPAAMASIMLLLPTWLGAAGLVPCTGVDCNACSLVELINNLIRFLIKLLAVLSAILFAWSGFLLVTAGDDTGQLEKAKQIFTNVVIGIVIVLAAWLIVDTVMKLLIANDGRVGETTLGPWNTLTCQPLASAISAQPSPGAGTLSHALATNKLALAGILIKNGISLEGLQPTAVSGVINLNQNCDCSVHVTSGTEGNHAAGTYSHANGYKLNLRTSDNANWLIT